MIRKTIALSVYISLVTALAELLMLIFLVLIIEFLQMLMKVMYIVIPQLKYTRWSIERLSKEQTVC